MPNIIFADSFDHYATADIFRKYSVINTNDIRIITGGRNSTNALYINSDDAYTYVNVNNLATFYIEFAYKCNNATNGRMICRAQDGTTNQVELWITASGFVQVQRNGTVIATGTTPVSQLVFTHYAWKCTIHNTAGVIEVRINGVADSALNLTNQNTRNTSNNYITRLGPSTTGNSNGQGLYYDDLVIATDAFSGDCRVKAILPQAAGNYAQWSVPASLYGNAGGSGSGRAVTSSQGGTNSLIGGNGLAPLMDGAMSPYSYLNAFTITGTEYVRFDFATARVITEVTIYGEAGSFNNGQWKWQGSPDASTWTDLGAAFSLIAPTAASPLIVPLTGNATAYRYYQMKAISGSVTANGGLVEINFRIDGSPAAWGCVDEAAMNGDLDYVSSGTAGQRNSYDFAAVGVTGNVKAVQHTVTVRKDDAGSRTVAQFMRGGSTDYDGSGISVSDGYLMQRRILLVNPATSAAWNTAEIDAAQFGTVLVS